MSRSRAEGWLDRGRTRKQPTTWVPTALLPPWSRKLISRLRPPGATRRIDIFRLLPAAFRDAAQELRFRRFLLAAVASLVAVLLIALCYELGLLEGRAVARSIGAILFLIGLFYFAFHTGVNRHFRDPSLTIPMMIASLLVTTYVIYSLRGGQGAYLMLYLMAMFFGVFRLSAPQMLAISGFVLLCYGGVIAARFGHGMSRQELSRELLQWIVLAAVLVWFSLMGGYVSRMVTRLGESEIDEVSGVYTRRRILEILRHERLRCNRGAGPLTVCLLDIDWFKALNDTHGHLAGDSALRATMAIVNAQLRSIDFVGRFGGDEFLIVLSQTNRKGGWRCASCHAAP